MKQNCLPEQFIKGLTTASLQGRAQIVPDRHFNIESSNELVFYLDGAHSPESMEVCARWFSLAISQQPYNSKLSHEFENLHHGEGAGRQSAQVKRRLNLIISNCF